MKQLLKIIAFLVLNFGALALGSYFMGGSPATNNWYIELKRAPWTPPGYFFGLAWTTIMILFTIFLAKNFTWNKRFIALLIAHYMLNIDRVEPCFLSLAFACFGLFCDSAFVCDSFQLFVLG
jgi:tryptophan-rich sensory protein